MEGRDGTSHTQYRGARIGEHCVERCLDVCTPSTYQSSITLPSMLSHEDEKQSVRRMCKNVSVRTLLQSFAVLPGKEEMAPLTGRGRSLLRAWMGSTYWRTMRRKMFGCVYSKHTLVIHYLAFNTRQCFLMRMINSV